MDMKNHKEYLTIGILAHVDAGKTTLSEGLLYLGQTIRKMGRVDTRDSYLDNNEMEREHGITIFSKQAAFSALTEGLDRTYTLLDTPGHADFSAEMERTLQVLDFAILVISAPDGVTGQVRTLWRLLDHYRVPVFVFVNKMDQKVPMKAGMPQGKGENLPSIEEILSPGELEEYGRIRRDLCGHLSEKLGGHFVDFGRELSDEGFQEDLALAEEDLMEAFLEGEAIGAVAAGRLIRERKVWPVLFGSALKMVGVRELLLALDTYAAEPIWKEEFGARVFKITREESGGRLTWMKLTGGSLKARTVLTLDRNGEEVQEKADQIRVYNGTRFQPLQEASAGMIVTVTGLTATYAGQGLGSEQKASEGLLQPVLASAIILPSAEDPFKAYRNLRQLEEEDPVLHITYDETKKEITAQVMGEMQREVLRRQAWDRFHLRIDYGTPAIVYKETIAAPVEGVGHFEPLRHYAEVHLLLEPGDPGSGLVFAADCPVNVLARNWQRLILTHLEERRHRGVLTGSDITDMKITVIGGRAHEKHTEGGDFRQATYRAVRQGLMMARSVLLEPVYRFRLEVPQDSLGHALTDLQQMGASFGQPDFEDTRAILEGLVPVSEMGDYARNLSAYTRGEGSLSVALEGYRPCHNTEEVLLERGYDPEADLRNPSSSVFCSHGVGTIVPWDQVRAYMQVDTGWEEETAPSYGYDEEEMEAYTAESVKAVRTRDTRSFKERQMDLMAAEDELMAIFERTYGKIPERVGEEAGRKSSPRTIGESLPPVYRKPRKMPEKEYLLVDGYNIIFAWQDLRDLAQTNIGAARDRLTDILLNFAGSRREHLILVFDAYRVPGGRGEVYHYHNMDVVYTKEAETADLYIEKAAHELTKQYKVTVATSDAVEQVIIFGTGAFRMSAQMLLEEIIVTQEKIRADYTDRPEEGKNYLLDGLSDEVKKALEDLPDPD